MCPKTSYLNYFEANYSSLQPLEWTYWYPYESTFQDAYLYYTNEYKSWAAIDRVIIEGSGNVGQDLQDEQDFQEDKILQNLVNPVQKTLCNFICMTYI